MNEKDFIAGSVEEKRVVNFSAKEKGIVS